MIQAALIQNRLGKFESNGLANMSSDVKGSEICH